MQALIYGAHGALGSAIVQRLRHDGHHVLTRSHDEALAGISELPILDTVVWAQGVNITDSLLAFDPSAYGAVIDSNVTLVARSLACLLEHQRLASVARLCVISSIWQNLSRPGKFSYTVSKAALAGLIHSAAADLGPRGILINAVLPGVVDTPMSRAQLSSEQLASITGDCPLGRLPTAEDVANAVAFLVGSENRSITGQCLVVDSGFSAVRYF